MVKKKNNGLLSLLSLALVVFMVFGLSACTENLTGFVQNIEIQNPATLKPETKEPNQSSEPSLTSKLEVLVKLIRF